MNPGTRLENYILFGLSLLAAVYFFVAYGQQDPRSAAKLNFSKEQIQAKAQRKLADLGYAKDKFRVSSVTFKSDARLLDSLQYHLGRADFVQWAKKNQDSNIQPFYWQVEFKPKGYSPSLADYLNNINHNEGKKIQLYLNTNGQFIGLYNSYDNFPQLTIRRPALASVIRSKPDTTNRQVLSDVSDSTLNRLLIFDLHKRHGPFAHHQKIPEAEVRRHFDHGYPYRYSINDARALAGFYLSKTGWDARELELDSAYVQRIHGMNVADLQYLSKNKPTGQQLKLNVAVAPTGALMHLNLNYESTTKQSESSQFLGDIIQAIFIVGVILVALIIFFFRIRSGTIDTASALIVALLLGGVMLANYYLNAIRLTNLFRGFTSVPESVLIYFMVLGLITASFTAVGYFILFSTGDSITRQYWPQKLLIYDHLRQGKFFNKPVGLMLMRSVALAFILCGVWTLLLMLFPNVYLSPSPLFRHLQGLWAPFRLVVNSGLQSAWIIFTIFLFMGGLMYGKTQNKWIAGVGMVVASSIFFPSVISFGPSLYQYICGGLMGAAMAFIFIKWDFFTLLLTYFLFLCLRGSATGWIIPHSPDLPSFILVAVLMGIAVVWGGISIFGGAAERSLPEYIPEYVKELAQEQRIKQELNIAREVQQSFLPIKTPTMAGLDIAAMCRPAHETGGDYYDFIPLDNHRLAVAIGDVSGKGIQAAFYMTLLKGMLHSLCRETDSPAEVLSKANKLFYENTSRGTFVSLIYGIIDVNNRTFTFARAGHNPIMHAKASSDEIKQLQPDGLGLGLTKEKIFDNKITEIELSITDDDLFLLYTDGIVEALNQFHEFYGNEKLMTLLKNKKNQSASVLISTIARKVLNFVGNASQHDDMTLMAIRFGNNDGS